MEIELVIKSGKVYFNSYDLICTKLWNKYILDYNEHYLMISNCIQKTPLYQTLSRRLITVSHFWATILVNHRRRYHLNKYLTLHCSSCSLGAEVVHFLIFDPVVDVLLIIWHLAPLWNRLYTQQTKITWNSFSLLLIFYKK